MVAIRRLPSLSSITYDINTWNNFDKRESQNQINKPSSTTSLILVDVLEAIIFEDMCEKIFFIYPSIVPTGLIEIIIIFFLSIFYP